MDRFSTFVCAGAIALVAVFAGATCAQAQMMRGNFDDADANHDGRVTLQEFEAYATGRLMAANGLMAQRFKEMTPQEQSARLQQRFEKLDRGNKGYLDRSDWDGT
jgi:Ca2+-binding EF-hand superfamily protein